MTEKNPCKYLAFRAQQQNISLALGKVWNRTRTVVQTQIHEWFVSNKLRKTTKMTLVLKISNKQNVCLQWTFEHTTLEHNCCNSNMCNVFNSEGKVSNQNIHFKHLNGNMKMGELKLNLNDLKVFRSKYSLFRRT